MRMRNGVMNELVSLSCWAIDCVVSWLTRCRLALEVSKAHRLIHTFDQGELHRCEVVCSFFSSLSKLLFSLSHCQEMWLEEERVVNSPSGCKSDG